MLYAIQWFTEHEDPETAAKLNKARAELRSASSSTANGSIASKDDSKAVVAAPARWGIRTTFMKFIAAILAFIR